MKTKIVIFLMLILFGCRTKKEVLKTEVKTSDTLYVKTETIKAPVLNQSLIIEQICDTITGEVVRFKKVFVIDGDSIQVLTDVNNSLQIKINQRERTLSQKDSIIQKLRKELSEVSEKVVYKKDWNAILWFSIVAFAIGAIRPWRFI